MIHMATITIVSEMTLKKEVLFMPGITEKVGFCDGHFYGWREQDCVRGGLLAPVEPGKGQPNCPYA